MSVRSERSGQLGRSASLALGCASIGNLYHPIDDDRAAATVDAAWDAGIRYFDTAPHYGLGLSERRLGAALAGRPRAEYTVSTKVGRQLVPVPGGGDRLDDGGFAVPATHRRVWDFSRDGVRRCLDESLDRLGLDRLDLVLLHDAEDHADQAIAEAYPALRKLRDEGVVGEIGAGSKDPAFLGRFVAECGPDAIIIAGRYTLLEQSAVDAILPACVAAGTAVLNAGIFNSGLLATERPHAGLPYEYGRAPAAVVERAAAIADLCAAHGTTLPAAALALAGSHPLIRSVIVGADSPEQVRQNAALFGTPPPVGLWSALVDAGLLDPRVIA